MENYIVMAIIIELKRRERYFYQVNDIEERFQRGYFGFDLGQVNVHGKIELTVALDITHINYRSVAGRVFIV